MSNVNAESVILTVANPYYIGTSPDTINIPNGNFTSISTDSATITDVVISNVTVAALTTDVVTVNNYIISSGPTLDIFSNTGGNINLDADNNIILTGATLDLTGTTSVVVNATPTINLASTASTTLTSTGTIFLTGATLDLTGTTSIIINATPTINLASTTSTTLTSTGTIFLTGATLDLTGTTSVIINATPVINLTSTTSTTLTSTGALSLTGSNVNLTSNTTDIVITSANNVNIDASAALRVINTPLVRFRDTTTFNMGLFNTQPIFIKDTVDGFQNGAGTTLLHTITLTDPPMVLLMNIFLTLRRTDGLDPHAYGIIQGTWRARWENNFSDIVQVGALITSLDASLVGASITVTDGGGGIIDINMVGIGGVNIVFRGYVDYTIQT